MPFRTAYKIVGQTVARAIEEKKVLDELSLDTLKEFSPLFEEDVYTEISLETCVAKRISAGGTGHDSVMAQIAFVEDYLKGKRKYLSMAAPVPPACGAMSGWPTAPISSC